MMAASCRHALTDARASNQAAITISCRLPVLRWFICPSSGTSAFDMRTKSSRAVPYSHQMSMGGILIWSKRTVGH